MCSQQHWQLGLAAENRALWFESLERITVSGGEYMTYSIIGILASIVLVISNRDILWVRSAEPLSPVLKNYRYFLFGVLGYYITDMLWGILESHGLITVLYADTAVHFLVMAAAVMLWSRYVVSYLGHKGVFATLLLRTGQLFAVFETLVVGINFFKPVLFGFDEQGAYHAGTLRYVTLAIQITLFILTSIYTLIITARSEGKEKRRHLTIGLFGIAMVLLIGIQVFYPLMPCYAMGYMLGTCLLHSFVVEDEKDEYRSELERQKVELEQSREALKDALCAAQEASRAKTVFLSNMSHEIRTPMNAIIGLNNIAMNDPTVSGKVRQYHEKIGSSAHHLLDIINDILDMSRIESGRMVIRSEDFSFARMLGQVNTVIGGQCREKGIAYDCRIEGSVDDRYIGDDMKLRQVLINILGNAVKFTAEGGKVSLTIRAVRSFEDKCVLSFEVRDNGIGMSEEFLEHVFEPFTQEDQSSTSRYGSTGLGMSITKSIVELMNGQIDVHSIKGKGSEFTVVVTLAKSSYEFSGDDTGDLCPSELSVLVIDDDSIALEYAGITLGQIGVRCDTAQSGKEGIDKVRLRHGRRADYDLILVDWKMPEMDGVETTRQIRSIVGGDTPIIILTSFNWDDIADEAKAAGVDSFAAKPLFAGAVMDEFRTAFRKKNSELIKKTADLRGRRVLLAEDVAVNAEIMMMVLSAREMQADLAENGRQAVDMFMQHEQGYYSAILMDMRMPEMDGLEATRAIRDSGRADAGDIPIIALTANAFDEDVQRSMQAGLNAHLSKPVEPQLLFETLESLIKT